MPVKDLPLELLKCYDGSTPCPPDFEEFWQRLTAQVWQMPLNFTVSPSEIPANSRCRYCDVWMDGINGSRIYAKYILPIREGPVPVVLQFHGYPGASRGWFEQSSLAGAGFAVLAMDCPGQGGKSVYAGAPMGTTAADHIVMGLSGPPEQMYYVEVFLETCLMVRLAQQLPELDASRLYVNGASQGGGLSLVCAALNSGRVRKCVSLYPFLSDYRRAWDMDRDTVVYTGMKYCNRWFDPTGERLNDMFEKLGYIDVLNFAPAIRCPVLFGTGLMDELIPPSAQFAVYSRITAPKERLIYPDYGHEEIGDFDDRIIEFLNREVD